MALASTALVWLRRDLRLADHPALTAALNDHDTIVPVFVHAPEEEAPWQPGAASRWWLHHSLTALQASLEDAGAKLVIRSGPSLETLQALIDETGATHVYFNRLYEPAIRERDEKVVSALDDQHIETHRYNGALLAEPWQIENKAGDPYKVFTPFWKALKAQLELSAPLAAPDTIPGKNDLDTESVDDLGLLPDIDWTQGLHDAWTPGESGAHDNLETFVAKVGDYKKKRDLPGVTGTSRLSPHLHFGELSPHQVAWAVEEATADSARDDSGKECFLSEIGWREFAHHLLHHFPDTPEAPLRPEFEDFPWQSADDNTESFEAWCRGRTGIPMVDAGMRELWETGWMHNRVRMIVASFLTKNQLIGWQAGARWFWDTLVDADLASNTLGWQWTAGCGADAAPFFRIFNPVRQGEKFDEDESYVRRWCPELKDVPDGKAHAPWELDPEERPDYPEPVADLKDSREAALEAYEKIKKS